MLGTVTIATAITTITTRKRRAEKLRPILESPRFGDFLLLEF